MAHKRTREPVTLTVQVEFDYVIDPLDDDPESPFELADLEAHEIYVQILDIPNVVEHGVSVKVKPKQ